MKKIIKFQKNTKIEHTIHNGIISKELMKNNIKNDPNTDYLFFSSPDCDTNLKYEFPDLQKYLKNKNKINEYNNEIYTINNLNSNNLNYFSKLQK